MRIIWLLLLSCVACTAAANLESTDAGVRPAREDANTGMDPTPPASGSPAPVRPPRFISVRPAADGGSPVLPPAAAAVPNRVEPPAAAPSKPPPVELAADGGMPAAQVDDDAGPPAPDPAPCTTHDCYCESYCRRGAALACAEDPPLAECVSLCQLPIKLGCEAAELTAMRCKAELPADKYVCDEDLLTFVVLGCEAEDLALRSCRTH